MKPLLYIYTKTLKNKIKELKNKPAEVILYIVILFFIIIGVVYSGFGTPKNSLSVSSEIYGAASTGVILVVIYFGIKQGIANGSSFFRMADVNMIFTAPISSIKVLMYGFLKQLSATFLSIIFLLFQLANLRRFLPLTGIGIFVVFLDIFLLVLTMSVLGVLTYSMVSRVNKLRSYVEKILNGLLIVLALDLFNIVFRYKNFLKAVITLLNNKIFLFLPLVGWFKAIMLYAINGGTSLFYMNLLIILIFIFFMIFAIYKLNTDFYEDVLAATNIKEEKITIKKSGIKNMKYSNIKVRKIKSGKIGSGASALFHRQILEYRKVGIPFIDKQTLIMLGLGVVSRYLIPGSNINTILFTSIYLLFFFTFQGKWAQELSKPYVFLMPGTTISKLFYSSLADIIKYSVDGFALFITAGVMFKTNPIISVLTAVCFVSFGTVYTYGNIFCRRLLVGTQSKNLIIVVKLFFITVLLILPGIIMFEILLTFSMNNPIFQFLPYIALISYNLLVSVFIMTLSKGIFEVLEMG